MMEYNIQKYQFHQDGKDYVVSTGLVGDRIRITCQENLALDGPFYSNEFSLHDLRAANQFFRLTQTSEEALNEINKGIERQKSGLRPGLNDTIEFLGYLVIGTDNDIYNLTLRRDYEPNKYGVFTPPASGAADLVLTTNYHTDGARLNMAERNAGDLQRDESAIEEELTATIPELNKLKKISIDIEEENALIRERLRILQKQLEEKKFRVNRLKEENANLKRDNLNLNNYIKSQENLIRDKQAYQTTVKVIQRPNVYPQGSAITSKFEQSAVKTFLPRTGAKPPTQDYNQDNNYITPATTLITADPNLYPTTNTVQTQYLTSTYQQPQIITQPTQIITQPAQIITQPPQIITQTPQIITQPQIITPQPVIISVQQPVANYSQKPVNLLRESNRSHTSGYSNPTYRAYLNSAQREPIYKNRVYDPNYSSRMAKNAQNKDVPYSSSMNKDIPYSSKLARANTNKDAPYSSQLAQINNNKDAPYSSQLAQINNNKDAPYSSRLAQINNNKDAPYSSQLAQINNNKDIPYSSRLAQINNNKDTPYSSRMASKSQNKDTPYTSTLANKSKIDGYSSKMGTMMNSSINGYSSQMAKTQGNNSSYRNPIGSRMPKANYGNYSGKPIGSRAPNASYSSKTHGSKSPDVGYSSYKPDGK